ncbi:glycosyltransferase family 4 protein, partial [Oceanobacillus senegalensis]
MEFIVALVITFMATLVITPFVIKFAIKVGAVDKPNNRKVHTKLMPRLGGLAIYSGFLIGVLAFFPDVLKYWPVLVGGLIIVITGIIDDMKELSAKMKLGGQLLAALITVLGGIKIEFITLPAGNIVEFGYFAIPLTILWIVAITNAINLIDGLDGLAAGVSSIVLLTFSGLAISMGNPTVALLGFMMLGSTLGFLKYNFNPAKIFMGDTGSLFLGYMISSLAVMGLFKNVAVFSLIVPIIILGVPILDTTFAII